MRPGFFSGSSPSDRFRGRLGLERAPQDARRAKLRRAALESLEERCLLATIPAPMVLDQVDISNPFEITDDETDESTPSIAVDPNNPQNLVASWTEFNADIDDPNFQVSVRLARSNDGGQNWTRIGTPGRRIDPSTGDNPAPYPTLADASVAFAPNGDFYMLELQHNAQTSGDLILARYSPGGALQSTATVYRWNRSAQGQNLAPAVMLPILAVDNTEARYTDPDDPTANVVNPHVGNVYVAYIEDTPPDGSPPNYNRETVELLRSTDGGSTFTQPTTNTLGSLNPGGNFGNQSNTTPRIAVSQGGGGSQPGQVTVVWDDFDSGANADPPRSFVRARQVLNGGATLGASSTIASTPTVRGNLAGGGTVGGLTANGVGPQPSIAVDNSLGFFSTYRGRIYVAYTTRIDSSRNPADNTDIFLSYSDNGGASWISAGRVNDDLATRDGFSEALGGFSGRPQFTPEVAVDRTTGTLVVQFYDARHDAARRRVATTVTASIDGGQTFSPQVFVNQPEAVFDVAIGEDRVVGPIPDNQGGGNPNADGRFGYGPRQGLSVNAGRIYTAWSGNLNGGLDGKAFLDIRVARSVIAAGPRIVDGTMGIVTTTNGSGTPQASQFDVTFDRPIDASTFSTDDVEIVGRRADGSALPAITATNVQRLSPTTFRVSFPAQSAPGTYSYAVGPNIRDLVRSTQTVVVPTRSLGTFDARSQDASQVDLRIPPSGTGGTGDPAQDLTVSTLNVAGGLAGEVVADLSVTLAIRHTFTGDLVLTLVSPSGTRVLLSSQNGGGGQDYFTTTFRDSASTSITNGNAPFNGTFRPQSALSNFDGEDPNGNWRLEINDTLGVDIGTLVDWSLDVGLGTAMTTTNAGNTMDQNGDGVEGDPALDQFSVPGTTTGVPFATPLQRDSLPLIVPGPRVVGTQVVNDDGTIGSAGPNLVLNGTVSALDVTFDREMQASTFTAEDVLRVVGPAGLIDPSTYTVEALGPRTFRVGFATQQLSGTYQLLLSSMIQSTGGFLVDTNQNAGVDRLRGGPVDPGVELAFKSSDVPLALPVGATVESTLEVDADFDIRDVNLQLNIDQDNVPDLRAELIGPDGTTVLLFDGVGDSGDRDDFVNTIFDDQADLPITLGSTPFPSRFQPQGNLNGAGLSLFNGKAAAGLYTLRISNTPGSGAGVDGTLNLWRLIFQRQIPGDGLGEPVADRIAADFRIFTMDQENGLSSGTWTAVGPASINNGGGAGRVTGLAVDPSDPSGNTVFVGGASGGVWKTNNFLTNDPEGPTYIPLLDQVATFGMNTGGIAVFGRNADPNQSVVIVATGEGDVFSRGVGLLRSSDGGLTWELLDSLDNRPAFADRGHELVGLTAFDVVVDPRPTITGEAVIYAAFSATGANGNGGVYRSLDSGDTWDRVLEGQATDLEVDPGSGVVDAFTNPTGNLLTIFAALRGQGVFLSPTQGSVGSWRLLGGGVGKPNILDLDVAPVRPVPTAAPAGTPNGAKGRIVLAKPFLTGDPRQDLLYSGWLYAAVSTVNDRLDGLYLTKDFGANWTKLRVPTLVDPDPTVVLAVPTNDITQPDYDPFGNTLFAQGNFDIALTIDPTNPQVVYLGGTRNGQPSGLIRVDATNVNDPHAFFLNNNLPGGGERRNYVNGAVSMEATANDDPRDNLPPLPPQFFPPDPRTTPYLNLLRNPNDPFADDITVSVINAGRFANSGAGVRWTPFDAILSGTTDVHRALSYVDPVSGRGRLIFGDDQGVFTGVDAGDGTLLRSIGNNQLATGSRNGNLQITQLYYGAAQPSDLTAQIAGALLYGQAQDDGFPRSDPNLLNNGNINWNGPFGDGTGVATDQSGSGSAYYYNWPCCGGDITSFFRFDSPDGAPNNGVGRTTGLIQSSSGTPVPDPQWPFLGGATFAVNPINAQQVVMSSPVSGRLFRTVNGGQNWFAIREPLSPSAYYPAVAFGAPENPDSGNTADYILAGDEAGRIFFTLDGGGSWTQINNGALEGNTSALQVVSPNPRPGSYEAYAITFNGVYHTADTRSASWEDVTGNLFEITHEIFGNPDAVDTLLKRGNLKALVPDWRYIIPDDFSNPPSPPTDPSRTHPALYVAGEGGVFVSYDDGGLWSRFPSAFPSSISTTPAVPGDGGGFPVADVRDLDLSLGHVQRTTGLPVATTTDDRGTANGPGLLVATTFGRGAYAIRLAPVVFPESLRLVLDGQRLEADPDQPPETRSVDLVFEGFSARTAGGNEIRIRAFLIGPDGEIGDPLPSIGGPTLTDSSGRFSIRLDPDDLGGDGLKTIGIQAIDQAGNAGNIAVFDVVFDTVAPDAPTALDLLALSDSGISDSDNYTNALAGSPTMARPTFGVAGAEAGTTLQLLRDGVVVAMTPEVAGGTLQITDDGVPDGTYTYVARLVDRAGNISGDSPSLSVTIDTIAPASPSAIALLQADDSGELGDGITNVTQPRLTGTIVLASNETSPSANLPLIQLVDAGGNVLGQGAVNPDGTFAVPVGSPLADGDYVVQARAVDRAGNVSQEGPSLTLRISTTLPPDVLLFLSPADDTGIPNDGITSVRRPRLIGSTGPNLRVELIDVNGSLPGSSPGAVIGSPVTSQATGTFVAQFPGDLPDGTYVVLARVTNVAGNVSQSAPLALTIDTTPPTNAPTLRLAPESDTGPIGDGRTTRRRPSLVGNTEPSAPIVIVGPDGAVLASGISDAQGGYRLQLASDLVNGTIALRARSRDAAGNPGPLSDVLNLTIESSGGRLRHRRPGRPGPVPARRRRRGGLRVRHPGFLGRRPRRHRERLPIGRPGLPLEPRGAPGRRHPGDRRLRRRRRLRRGDLPPRQRPDAGGLGVDHPRLPERTSVGPLRRLGARRAGPGRLRRRRDHRHRRLPTRQRPAPRGRGVVHPPLGRRCRRPGLLRRRRRHRPAGAGRLRRRRPRRHRHLPARQRPGPRGGPVVRPPLGPQRHRLHRSPRRLRRALRPGGGSTSPSRPTTTATAGPTSPPIARRAPNGSSCGPASPPNWPASASPSAPSATSRPRATTTPTAWPTWPSSATRSASGRSGGRPTGSPRSPTSAPMAMCRCWPPLAYRDPRIGVAITPGPASSSAASIGIAARQATAAPAVTLDLGRQASRFSSRRTGQRGRRDPSAPPRPAPRRLPVPGRRPPRRAEGPELARLILLRGPNGGRRRRRAAGPFDDGRRRAPPVNDRPLKQTARTWTRPPLPVGVPIPEAS